MSVESNTSKQPCPKLCESCPFIAGGTRGGRLALWGHTPEEVWEALKSEASFTCIESCVLPPNSSLVELFTVDTVSCAGAAIIRRQMGKLPRDPVEARFAKLASGWADSGEGAIRLLETKERFVNYHRGNEDVAEDVVKGNYENRIERLKEELRRTRQTKDEAMEVADKAMKRVERAEGIASGLVGAAADCVVEVLGALSWRVENPAATERLDIKVSESERRLRCMFDENNFSSLYHFWDIVKSKMLTPPDSSTPRKFRRKVGKPE